MYPLGSSGHGHKNCSSDSFDIHCKGIRIEMEITEREGFHFQDVFGILFVDGGKIGQRGSRLCMWS